MAGVAEKFDRNSTLSVVRGLYVLRYVSVQEGAKPPIAYVESSPGAESVLEIVSAPWLPEGQLNRPGDCLVIRAEAPADVMVGLRRDTPAGSLDASFRLEALSLAEENESVVSGEARERPAPVFAKMMPRVPAPFGLLAHISMRGDVVVGEDEWAGGPDAPSPIEGLELRGDAADGASLELQVLVSSRPPRWSNWVSAGQYAGTRGKYLQLIGVRLRLSGPKTDRLEMAADALFLGSLVMSKRGREIEFLSKSGVDPLVGLRLRGASMQMPANTAAIFASGREKEGRVRVFRASAHA